MTLKYNVKEESLKDVNILKFQDKVKEKIKDRIGNFIGKFKK